MQNKDNRNGQFTTNCPFYSLCYGATGSRKHIFNEYSVTNSWIVYHNVGHRTDQLAVLNDRGAGHECVQVGTTVLLKEDIK